MIEHKKIDLRCAIKTVDHYGTATDENEAIHVENCNCEIRIPKVAKDAQVEDRISWYNDSTKLGRIIHNDLRDGDQVVAVEWNDGDVRKVNINDLVILNPITKING